MADVERLNSLQAGVERLHSTHMEDRLHSLEVDMEYLPSLRRFHHLQSSVERLHDQVAETRVQLGQWEDQTRVGDANCQRRSRNVYTEGVLHSITAMFMLVVLYSVVYETA